MQQKIVLKLTHAEAESSQHILNYIANTTAQLKSNITGFHILKKSIDARSRAQVWVNLTLNVFINEPFYERTKHTLQLQNVHTAIKKVVIVGAGPCGLFAALQLIELGIQPIILERGKDVKARRRDLALLNREGIVNPESNYCFGEGGAGTYSDGKLYTRSNKRGSIDRILNILVEFGAPQNILYEAHPHIGTNKLPQIMVAMRQAIVNYGGQFLFQQKVTHFTISNNKIKSVTTTGKNIFEANAFIVATGHSARDVFELLHHNNIAVEAKPFALGVRIEHPQALIDSIQYHCTVRNQYLPPASYNLVQQVQDKGVFSFCMCPGGIIAPAATSSGELVVNGWSPSKRNNPFANSGMVVTVSLKDIADWIKKNKLPFAATYPLAAMYFQQWVEQNAYKAGGGKFVAPAQRMADFVSGKISAQLPACSYLPGITSVALNNVLPGFVYKSLQGALQEFGKKMHGYYTNDAVLVATESRTSSPVRIPRNDITLQHPQVKNLYPAGEGAGYAGGIVSAAMDGEKIARTIAMQWM
jgi:uncharacterized protein